jgi:hypothetical protein
MMSEMMALSTKLLGQKFDDSKARKQPAERAALLGLAEQNPKLAIISRPQMTP